MNRYIVKRYLTVCAGLVLLIANYSCNKKDNTSDSKVLLNEILINNETNFQDDYGIQSPWIEVFNKSFGSIDIAGYRIAFFRPGIDTDTTEYFIPKGDVLTVIKPRQHALFWADGKPNHGTFHTNFRLDTIGDIWIGLYDSGRKLLDCVYIKENMLKADESYGRVSDADMEWEIKGSGIDNYVTPSTNNKTIGKNPKIVKFEEHDKIGIGMSIIAMSVVFAGLILLYLSFRVIGIIAVSRSKSRAMKAQGVSSDSKKEVHQSPGEVYAAIAMAMHEFQNVHDVEDTVLTINKVKRAYSPWSSKIYGLRETPNRK